MKRWSLSMMCVVLLCGISLTVASAMAAEEDRLNVPVAFGRGLNTAQPPTNPENQAILPDTITVTAGGVVHFLVAGFHQVVVYNPGTTPEDIVVPASGTFINDPTNQFYLGINPAGGPLGTPGTTDPSNASNQLESVSFAEPGTYLVICNVRGHFLNGMFAVVKVKAEAEE